MENKIISSREMVFSTLQASGIIPWYHSEKRDELKALIGKQGSIYSLLLQHYHLVGEKLDSLTEDQKRVIWEESFNYNNKLSATERLEMCKAIWALMFIV